MNMSRLMGRFSYGFLLVFCCFTFVSIYGKPSDSTSSCETKLVVRRGTTRKTAPQQNLTVRCTVKHCGQSLNVFWCKQVDTVTCQQINNTKNVEITQSDDDVKKLTSFLTFKWISTHDDGLYRCDLRGNNYSLISHTINVSVSDIYQGVENVDYSADDESPSADGDGDKDMSWLPYFLIVVSFALLIITLTALTFLGFHGFKRKLTYNLKKAQEMSTRTLPECCKGSTSSISVVHFSSTTAGTPPSLMTDGNQPTVAPTADKSQASDNAVYAAINHTQSMMPAREQGTSTEKDKKPQYATINVP
ncbi:B- and T-lymphocyte attenuator [Thunnus albacares]|uniref:B- and T-lymphocyte attenuator n=1 Tax=Thunnus albacares TaxID=8236 RepID=UPI001C4D38F1|nr:B- and T-lymphocyte attenuator isoform X2 [Thunnus maccoyii]XP_044221900.1 B- and T-lymphocyte attenuator [Thunnus albacares]